MYKKIHIKALDKCIVYINGNCIGFIDNEKIYELYFLTKLSELIVTTYPIQNSPEISQLLNFKINTNLNNNDITSSFYNTFISDDNIYIFINNLHKLINNNGKTIAFRRNDKQILVTKNTSNSIVIDNNNISIDTDININDILKIIYDNSLILLYNINSYEFSLYSTKNKLYILGGIYKEIKINEKNVELLLDNNDSHHHGKIIKINDGKVAIDNIYLQSQTNNQATSNILSVMSFLDCIKHKDYQTARSFMNTKLQEKGPSDLADYFEDVLMFYYLNKNSSNNFINIGTINLENKSSIYAFSLEDNKIVDIDKT